MQVSFFDFEEILYNDGTTSCFRYYTMFKKQHPYGNNPYCFCHFVRNKLYH